jgi:hypothetical protein
MRPVTWSVPFGKSTLIPAGCLHWPIGEKDLLREWVRSVAEAENGFTILMGDALDCARTHYRKHIRSYQEDENSQEALDAWHRKDVEALAKELAPIKKKIIGAISGNHYWQFIDGTTSDQYLCQLLGIRYLGPMAAVRIEYKNPRGKVIHRMTLIAHHNGGSNGGRTTGGDVNGLLKLEHTFDADIYLLSHTHRRHGHKETVLTLSVKGEPTVLERTKVFVRTGAFLKGFKADNPTVNAPHFPGYAEAAAYRPTDLGWVTIDINLRQGASSPRSRRQYQIKQDIRLSY